MPKIASNLAYSFAFLFASRLAFSFPPNHASCFYFGIASKIDSFVAS